MRFVAIAASLAGAVVFAALIPLGNTFIALGNGSQIELAGVSLTASQIHMTFA